MAFTRVQGKSARGSSNGNTVSVTFNSTPTAGNLIIVQAIGSRVSGSFTFTVSDNKGNTYNQAALSALNDRGRSGIFYAYNIASSATFTVTCKDTDFPATTPANTIEIAISEWSGFGASDPVALNTTGTGSGTSVSTGTTAAAPENNCVIAAVFTSRNDGGSSTVDAETPAWTQEFEDLADFPSGEADTRIVTAGGTQSCHWTTSSSVNWSAALAVFVEAAPHPPIRATQIVQGVSSINPPTPVRATQIVQGLSTTYPAKIRVTQVVQTIVAIIPPGEEPPVDIPVISQTAWRLYRIDLKSRHEERA